MRDDDDDGLPGVTITNSNQGAQHCVFRTSTHGMSATLGAGTVVGARVDDDAPLPTTTTDPTVSDDDGDGWPAVTLRSSTYAQDIVYRRFIRELSGTIVDADLITGAYRADAEASVVSWQDFMVPAGPGRPSAFRLTRTDPVTTCADVRADADALLAAFPAPAIDDCPAPTS